MSTAGIQQYRLSVFLWQRRIRSRLNKQLPKALSATLCATLNGHELARAWTISSIQISARELLRIRRTCCGTIHCWEQDFIIKCSAILRYTSRQRQISSTTPSQCLHPFSHVALASAVVFSRFTVYWCCCRRTDQLPLGWSREKQASSASRTFLQPAVTFSRRATLPLYDAQDKKTTWDTYFLCHIVDARDLAPIG